MIRNDLPRSLVDNPSIDRWVGFEPGGAVRLGTGKVELGQGILTALQQMAAEELDVAPARIRVVSGETGDTPEEGFTAGSQSVEASGAAIRTVCAEVRQIFLAEAATRLGCVPGVLSVEDGRILRAGVATALDYWVLADAVDLRRRVTGSAPLRSPARFRVIGQSVRRLDLPGKLRGGAFIHDMAPAGLVHARVLRAPRRGARLITLDMPAVERGARAPVQLVRAGEFVALAAMDEAVAARALDAARRVAVWDGGQVLQDGDAAALSLLGLPGEERVVEVPGRADVAAVRVVAARYTRPYLAHASIGACCALALWEGGRLAVWSHSQGVGPLRAALARCLALDPEAVTVLHRPSSGCYGHNGADDVALDAALVAMALPGRTARVQWDAGGRARCGAVRRGLSRPDAGRARRGGADGELGDGDLEPDAWAAAGDGRPGEPAGGGCAA